MSVLPEPVVDELEPIVLELARGLRSRIPDRPAAALGRLGLPGDGSHGDFRPGFSATIAERPDAELSALGPLLPERILGALEMAVADLDTPPMPAVAALVPPPPDGMYGFATMGGGGETQAAVAKLAAMRPGALDLVVSATARLAERAGAVGHPSPPSPSGLSEEAVAAAHGRSQLAAGVAVAALVLRALGLGDDPATVIGAGVIAATKVLRVAPMPAEYEAARIEKIRQQYLYPRQNACQVRVHEHRFALTESEFPAESDFAENGLVAVVPGGIVVRTGTSDGRVYIVVEVLDSEPAYDDFSVWDEVVEVTWRAERGLASILGGPPAPGDYDAGSGAELTPPWPGTYRVRVRATNRDEDDDQETYRLTVWQAPAAEPVVHKRQDRLGHRLRGEPEPRRETGPADAYTWVEKSAIAEAGTITVVAQGDPESVIRSFGGDPAAAEPIQQLVDTAMTHGDPWIAVGPVAGGVMAVEDNGYQRSHAAELRALSAGTRAASLYWNVNGVTRLSFAADGRLLAAFELGEQCDETSIEPLLRDLDFREFRHRLAKGLLAVARFTDTEFTADHLARIEAEGVGFAVVPLLDDLHPAALRPDGTRLAFGSGPLGADTDRLTELPRDRQRDLAWWVVQRTAEHVGLAGDHDVVDSIATRALTPEAELRARKSRLGDRVNYWFWLCLHQATNADPLAAAVSTLESAQYAHSPSPGDFTDEVRRMISRWG
ncbi:hypothetical protein DFR69_107137 [Nocardia neocaledoniensis]|uniref:Uncharacterized protein n=2 Tax=Nocardia neocaledoniensis TaxID=236511 RepID=A0A317NER9_9NOCA|nr:hypothetical protein DFR69_107137 [Nocardia neocaledoniensis]